jgi:hypothetical protein
MGESGELLTRKQAAALLGITVRHLYTIRMQARDRGEVLEFYNPHTGQVRLKKKAILALKRDRQTFEPVRQAS